MAEMQEAAGASMPIGGTEIEKAMGMNDATDMGEARLSLHGIVMMTVQQMRRARKLRNGTGERKWQVVGMKRIGTKGPIEPQNPNGWMSRMTRSKHIHRRTFSDGKRR